MRQFPLELLEVAPGRVREWALRSTAVNLPGQRAAGSRDASFNQDKHFTVAEESRADADPVASWLAVTFEVAGPLDTEALEHAILQLARRHEVLRCEFRRLAGLLTCDPLPPASLRLESLDVGDFTSTEELRTFLGERFRRSIDTLGWPLFTVGAVVRETSSTVYFALDHIVCDGMSLPVIVNEVQQAYAARLRGDRTEPPAAPSYLDFAAEQRRRFLEIDAGDPRLDHWKAFVARNGELFPRFPLDLGVAPGRCHPIVNEAAPLLDATEADALERVCHEAGGKPFMGVLAAMALCLREAGGPDVYRGFMPVSERGRGTWDEAVGWFVNTMPIEFAVPAEAGFAELVRGVRAGFGEMIEHIDVPFVRAWQLLAPQQFAARSWPYPVNFFSYIDMRRCPGAEHHAEWRPTTHVWSARANGACTWFQRDTAGLHMNSIHVDTPEARRTMRDFHAALSRTVRDVARTGEVRVPAASAATLR